MDNSSVNIDLIRDHVDTIILSTLLDGDKYGLEILNEINEKSMGLYKLKQPTLYSCLKRLETKLGYITSYSGDSSNGAKRVYYALLDDGKKFLLNDQLQWEYSRTIIDKLVSSREFDPNETKPFEASDLRPRTKRTPNSDKNESVEPIDLSNSLSDDNYQEDLTQIPIELTKNIDNTIDDDSTASTLSLDKTETAVDNSTFLIDKNVDYVNVMNNLFDIPDMQEQPAQTEYVSNPVYDNYVQYNESQVNVGVSKYTMDMMQKTMALSGIKLKPYYKNNTTDFYINKYYYSNKLFMVSSFFTYALFFVMLIIMHFSTAAKFGTDSKWLWITLGIGALYPIISSFNYFVNPTKRIMANFNLKKTMLYSFIFLINAALLVITIGFLGCGANFTEPSSIIRPVLFPLLLLLIVPASIFVYSILYNSSHYHVN